MKYAGRVARIADSDGAARLLVGDHDYLAADSIISCKFSYLEDESKLNGSWTDRETGRQPMFNFEFSKGFFIFIFYLLKFHQ